MLNQVIQGDCLEVMRQIPDGSVDAVITDPPYGIDYQSARRTDKASRLKKIANDKRPFVWFLPEAYRITKEGGVLVCFCRWDVQEAFRLAIEWAGFTIKSQVIWDREIHGMGDLGGSFGPQHDVIWFATKGSFKFPGKRPKSIIRSKRLQGVDLIHPNEKPIDLMQQLNRAVTPAGGLIVDPFSGSGATGTAAVMDGYRFIGSELDPKYVEIANKRINEALGRLPGVAS